MLQSRDTSGRGLWLLLAVILGTGTALRWHLLGAKSIWTDEAVGVALAQASWTGFWREVWAYEGNMALYYLLLRGWIQLGDSEVAIRSFSALFGVAASVAIYLFAGRFLGRKTALISAILLAVHAAHIQFSQEARSYSLLVFLLILSAYFFLRALEAPNRKEYWVVHILTSALAVYAHVLAILVIASQWLSLGLSRMKRIASATLLWLAAVFAGLVAPMGAFVLLQNRGQIDWIPPLTSGRLLESFRFLAGGRSDALLAAYLGLSLLAVAHTAFSKKESPTRHRDELPVRVFASWLVFPIGFMFCFSLLKPLLYSRYLILCVPALVLLAAQGTVALERLFPRLQGVAVVAVLAMVGMALNGVAQYYESFPYHGNDWRSASRYILERQRPGDAVFFYIPAGHRPFLYYAKRQSGAGTPSWPAIVFPTSEMRHNDYRFKLSSDQVSVLTRGHQRVWLVLHLEGAHEGAPVRSLLPENLHLLEERQFSGFHGTGNPIRVALYGRETVESVLSSRH